MAVTKKGSPSRFESLTDKPHVFFGKFLKDRFPLITDHHLASGNVPDTQSKRKDQFTISADAGCLVTPVCGDCFHLRQPAAPSLDQTHTDKMLIV